MDKFNINELLNYISPRLREPLKRIDMSIWDRAEEIRITNGKPAMICYNNGFEYVNSSDRPFICDVLTVKETMMLITDNSIYAANDKLINGFITLKGGHRAGICGTVVLNNGKISAIKDISGINIRIKREIFGVADKIIKHVIDGNMVMNTLIIAPPQCGKTTLLRDISRILGERRKISVVDERSEIAAMYNGIPQNDVGLRTDVLDACPKCIGIPLVIRSMSPEIIITDEIGGENDADAINYAINSGAKIITSAHGSNIRELNRRKFFKDILGFFDLYIVLTNKGGTGKVKEVIRRKEIDI